jgi:hypothetical protein
MTGPARPHDAADRLAICYRNATMRHGSLFAALRGRDGRSLARALMVLVLVSLFAGGFNTGAAAVGGDPAFCKVDASSGAPDAPHHAEPDCCLIGATPFGLALAAAPPAADAPGFAPLGDRHPFAAFALDAAESVHATARGPPLDA